RVVRAVKPLLLGIERRIIIFVKHIVKPFLPPAKKWILCHTMRSHLPYREAHFPIGKRNRGNTSQGGITLDEVGVACEVETADEDDDERERSGCIATSA